MVKPDLCGSQLTVLSYTPPNRICRRPSFQISATPSTRFTPRSMDAWLLSLTDALHLMTEIAQDTRSGRGPLESSTPRLAEARCGLWVTNCETSTGRGLSSKFLCSHRNNTVWSARHADMSRARHRYTLSSMPREAARRHCRERPGCSIWHTDACPPSMSCRVV